MTMDTIERPIAPDPLAPTAAEPLMHLARCAECDFAVRFTPSTSGASFTLIDSDRALGIGEQGRPTCPNGHGEMSLADEQLPAAEAVTEVAARVEAETQRLPFPAPPFNYENALHSLYEKRKQVAALEKRVEERKESLKYAKDDLDRAHEQLGEMIERYEQDEHDRLHEIARRESAAAAGHPEGTTLVRCSWEQAHPDEDCPICEDPEYATAHWYGDTARDSALHVDAVDRMLRAQATDEILGLVEDAGLRLSADTVNGWSDEDRAIVKGWAEAETGLADKPEDHARPAVLGTAHVASEPGSQKQSCKACGAVLLADAKENDTSFYAVGTLVGTDCPGIEKDPARQITRGKKGTKAAV